MKKVWNFIEGFSMITRISCALGATTLLFGLTLDWAKKEFRDLKN